MNSNTRSGILQLLGLNWTTILGSNLAFISAIADLVVLVLIGIGAIHHAYVGIVAFLLLPGIFILGSLLIIFGIWEHKRQKMTGGVSSRVELILTQIPC